VQKAELGCLTFRGLGSKCFDYPKRVFDKLWHTDTQEGICVLSSRTRKLQIKREEFGDHTKEKEQYAKHVELQKSGGLFATNQERKWAYTEWKLKGRVVIWGGAKSVSNKKPRRGRNDRCWMHKS
jgi:hypothetical protein